MNFEKKECSKVAVLIKITHAFSKYATWRGARKKSDEKDRYPVFCIQNFYDDIDVTFFDVIVCG